MPVMPAALTDCADVNSAGVMNCAGDGPLRASGMRGCGGNEGKEEWGEGRPGESARRLGGRHELRGGDGLPSTRAQQ
eukprot:146423-Chlamydomonas_euryale.AAC.3